MGYKYQETLTRLNDGHDKKNTLINSFIQFTTVCKAFTKSTVLRNFLSLISWEFWSSMVVQSLIVYIFDPGDAISGDTKWHET